MNNTNNNNVKTIILPNYALIKFVNIMDKEESILSYSYTPLFKFRFSIELPVDKNDYIKIEPISNNITKEYIYTLSNNFTFSLYNKINEEYVKTSFKSINNENNVKYIPYNNYFDLQIKIINIINNGQLFEVKPDLNKLKISNNIDVKMINNNYYLKITKVEEKELHEPTIAYKITYKNNINAFGFLVF